MVFLVFGFWGSPYTHTHTHTHTHTLELHFSEWIGSMRRPNSNTRLLGLDLTSDQKEQAVPSDNSE